MLQFDRLLRTCRPPIAARSDPKRVKLWRTGLPTGVGAMIRYFLGVHVCVCICVTILSRRPSLSWAKRKKACMTYFNNSPTRDCGRICTPPLNASHDDVFASQGTPTDKKTTTAMTSENTNFQHRKVLNRQNGDAVKVCY